LRLVPEWAFACSIVLAVFYFFDLMMYKREIKDNPNLATANNSETKKFTSMEKDINSSLKLLDIDEISDSRKIHFKSLLKVKENLTRVKKTLREVKMIKNEEKFGIDGKLNFLFLFGIIFCIFMQGVMVKRFPGIWPHFGPQELGMLLFTGLSLLVTPLKNEARVKNGFTFGPIKEVALIFAGIFATMIPALHILQQKGAALGVVKPWQFFWASGLLSSFLDNAPTYLTFLSIAKGLNLPNDLGFTLNDGTGLSAAVLAAISCGAVFMGANTYIGNGPNFMVRSIAEENGVKMPSFFGYMLYSFCILIPIFVLITFIFFV
jgi:Na+/H+ antiporter NhaD/arsenite permease-like protein